MTCGFRPRPAIQPPPLRSPAASPPPPGSRAARTAPSPPPCESFTWEVIIVNDGSKDATAAVAGRYVEAEGADAVRLLNLHANSGKGAAVRKGANRARGRYVLMADADGATRFADVAALLAAADALVASDGTGAGAAFAIGSRAHMGDSGGAGGGVQRSGLRSLLMWGFHTYMSVMIGGAGGIRDTQCGFKLFTRPAAVALFGALHIERWAFDVELVFLAAQLGLPMVVRACARGVEERRAGSDGVYFRAVVVIRTSAQLHSPAHTRTSHAAGGARYVARGGRIQGEPRRG